MTEPDPDAPTSTGSSPPPARPLAAGGVTRRVHSFLRTLGPGLVAAASDVDPTTVATVAVIGATTVYALSWLTVLVFPILAAVLLISSKVGVVTGEDLQTLVRLRFGRGGQLLFLGSILVVTILVIAADLEAGAAALGLLLHTSWEPRVRAGRDRRAGPAAARHVRRDPAGAEVHHARAARIRRGGVRRPRRLELGGEGRVCADRVARQGLRRRRTRAARDDTHELRVRVAHDRARRGKAGARLV